MRRAGRSDTNRRCYRSGPPRPAVDADAYVSSTSTSLSSCRHHGACVTAGLGAALGAWLYLDDETDIIELQGR